MDQLSERRFVSPYHLALVNCALGRNEAALDLLEQAYDTGDAKVLWMGVDPELDPLHGHPRFNDLLRRSPDNFGKNRNRSPYCRSACSARPERIPATNISVSDLLTH
jgi:hypothetical protein